MIFIALAQQVGLWVLDKDYSFGDVALAGAGVAYQSADSVISNPALASSEKQVSAGVGAFFDSSLSVVASGSYPIASANGLTAAGYVVYDSVNVERYELEGNELVMSGSGKESTILLGAGGSYALQGGFKVGALVKVLRYSLSTGASQVSSTSFGLDLGAYYSRNMKSGFLKGLNFGFSIKNLAASFATSSGSFSGPLALNVGVVAPMNLSGKELAVAVSVSKALNVQNSQIVFGGAASYKINQSFGVGAGYRYAGGAGDYLSLGAEFEKDKMSFGFAFRYLLGLQSQDIVARLSYKI